MDDWNLPLLWEGLIWPLLRLLAGMSIGIFLGAFLEYMGWIRNLARLFAPLIKMGNFGTSTEASFAVAFASPAAANSLLSGAWRKGEIGRTELTLANICNSLPASLIHLPNIFFLAWPVIGAWSLCLAGINLSVAALRTLCALGAARLLLRAPVKEYGASPDSGKNSENQATRLRMALAKAWRNLKKRLWRLTIYTTPCFIVVWLARERGFFDLARNWLAQNLDNWASFLDPATIGLVILQLAAESGASLGAAGALLETGSLSGRDIVAALVFGALLATPIRAARHQFPALAGFYAPAMALWLVLINQGTRAIFMAFALTLYLLAFGGA